MWEETEEIDEKAENICKCQKFFVTLQAGRQMQNA